MLFGTSTKTPVYHVLFVGAHMLNADAPPPPTSPVDWLLPWDCCLVWLLVPKAVATPGCRWLGLMLLAAAVFRVWKLGAMCHSV